MNDGIIINGTIYVLKNNCNRTPYSACQQCELSEHCNEDHLICKCFKNRKDEYFVKDFGFETLKEENIRLKEKIAYMESQPPTKELIEKVIVMHFRNMCDTIESDAEWIIKHWSDE